MSWLKTIFRSQSSQERKVYYEKDTQTTKNDENKTKITESNLEQEQEQIDDTQLNNIDTQPSQDSQWSSWSGLSLPLSSQKGEKKDLSDDEEEQWWEPFCNESTKKDESWECASSSSQQKEDEPQRSSSSQPKEDDTEVDDEEDDAKVSFYLKVDKYKKFKYMRNSRLDTKTWIMQIEAE